MYRISWALAVAFTLLLNMHRVSAASILDDEDYLSDPRNRGQRNDAKEDEEGLDTWGITDTTLTCTDCLDYKWIGVCFWLKCRVWPPSCEVYESILVSHYLPDFVVSVYSNESPWDGLGGLTDREPGAIQTEKSDVHDRVTQHTNQIDTNLDFKHADIITHPGIVVFNSIAESQGYSCQSVESIPMMPHFVSSLDPAWVRPIVEQYYPQAILGFPRMSRLPELWGPIYPRTGWTSLPFDAMSALVTAQRASEILTGGASLHVFMPPGDDCGEKCWPPPAVELDGRDNKFQMLYPFAESKAAPLPRHGGWINGMEVEDQRYSWTLWRRYECCEKEGQVFLGRIATE
jgi:integrating conjugative element protein (TIGR03756 family)